RAGAAREAMLRELEGLRRRAVELDASLAEARERVTAVDAAVESGRKRRDATTDEFAQREADERAAQSEEREAGVAGEAGRRRLAEIDAELGMLQQGFAQNPATDDEQRDVLERYAGEPEEIVDELPRLREEL